MWILYELTNANLTIISCSCEYPVGLNRPSTAQAVNRPDRFKKLYLLRLYDNLT